MTGITPPSIGFVGAGRVAWSLAHALAAVGHPGIAIHSRNRTRAAALAAALPGCVVAATPQAVADACDRVFLAVPDDAIAAVCSSVVWRPGQGAIHCSGALGLEVLAAARAAGAFAGAFHPLMLFTDPASTPREAAIRALKGAAIAIEADGGLQEELAALVDALHATRLIVPPGARAAYHAGSHYAAAFLCVLLAEGEAILEEAGIDRDAARAGLQALARGTLDAVARSDPARAMAGAYARGDAGTARRHLDALASPGGAHAPLYRQLARHSVRLAREAGRLDDARAKALLALLAEPGPAPEGRSPKEDKR